MKRILQIIGFIFPVLTFAQNITVDSQTYTVQQLVEDILINSSCIENVVVNNVVGGDFGGTTQSYGYFDANGSGFPFQNGIVLSTGRLTNVPGPNSSLSDDNAPGWAGDTDLEIALSENNTINATILEFDFTAVASQISFRYIFASEEYQEGNANTCQYSDLFGFLIRLANSTQYTNIALVPNTSTPVKVTTVHPDIPGGCPAINEAYFGSWNGSVSPINFNGQTKILTATADVSPNVTYHVKLVIADEQNYRYDSAVFLEAGSFQLSTELGPDLLISTGNALCENDIFTLNASQANATGFKWFKDGIELLTETSATLTVVDAGLYTVEVTLNNACISYGEIVIEYSPNIVVTDATLTECDQNQDGITLYNLFDGEGSLTNNNNSLSVSNFFLTQLNATQNTNAIPNPNNFQNATPNQVVFARVQNQDGCFKVAQLQLAISTNTVTIMPQFACDNDPIDGFIDFDLNDITATFQNQIPPSATVNYFLNDVDAFSNVNSLSSPFQNTIQNSQTLYVKITDNNQCYAITTVQLNVLYTPVLLEDESVFYCLNNFPDTIRIYGGVLNDSPSNYYYEWLFNGSTTPVNTSFNDVNEAGTYTVIVTDPNGCNATRTITVTASDIATIDDVIVVGASENNTITVLATGLGFYDYAIDDANGFYQESNLFTNVSSGFHTIYVRDRNGCGIAEQLVSVLGFPKYFTPNGDTYNETWKAKGVSAQFYQGIDIKIFDRFGKLLAQQDHLSIGWNGTLNGYNLPSDDYWFMATLPDGKTYTGHFALVR